MSKKVPKGPAQKAEKTEKPQASKTQRKGITLPGQQKFGSFREAMGHVEETLGRLHIQSHDKLSGKGIG